MGTNYYTYIKLIDYCEHCKRGIEKLHIGKQSIGWKFLFRGYKEPMEFLFETGRVSVKLDSKKAWIDFIKEKNLQIDDEYGQVVSLEDFVFMVKGSSKGLSSCEYQGPKITGSLEAWNSVKDKHYKDNEGYEFCTEWFS
jgi:hypothetical protein